MKKRQTAASAKDKKKNLVREDVSDSDPKTHKKDYIIGNASQIEPWQKDVSFFEVMAQEGYRVNCSTWSLCLKSIFHWHNQTINIWVNLAALGATCVLAYTFLE